MISLPLYSFFSTAVPTQFQTKITDKNYRRKLQTKISDKNLRRKSQTKISDESLRQRYQTKILDKISDKNLRRKFQTNVRNSRQRQFRDKTAYVGGQDFRPKLRFSCSVATALQRFVPPWRRLEFQSMLEWYKRWTV